MNVRFKALAITTSIPVALSALLATVTTPVSAALDSTYSIRSYNYAGIYIRHRNALGEVAIVGTELDRKDATFRVVHGLAGDCSSFESVNYPGYYLRHQNSRIKLNQAQNSDLFQKDATFCIRKRPKGYRAIRV